MTIEVFYDSTRPTAPWCIQYDGRLDRQAHFESRHRAEQVARGQGWKPALRDELVHFLDELFCESPEHAADVLLDRFNITEKDTTK